MLARQNQTLQETLLKLEQETAQRLQAVEELRRKDQIMLQQSRMAAMGEMLNNIAHQWRQPLNLLGLKIEEIGLFHDAAELSGEFLNANIAKVMEILRHMSQTIDDFQNFTAPDKEKSRFPVREVAQRTLSLLEGSFRLETRTTISSVVARRFPGVTVMAAENGQVGLELCRKHAPALVITDINMPVMDGLKMIEEIKATCHETKFIVMTGYSDRYHLDNTSQLGISGLLVKPVELWELFAVSEKCLAETRAEQNC